MWILLKKTRWPIEISSDNSDEGNTNEENSNQENFY